MLGAPIPTVLQIQLTSDVVLQGVQRSLATKEVVLPAWVSLQVHAILQLIVAAALYNRTILG